MSTADVTKQGLTDTTPGREARMWEQGRQPSGGSGRRGRGGRKGGGGRAERSMVPDATFSSYYGRPVIKPPVWSELDIAGYLFTGGLAAGSALLAAGADLTDRPELRRAGRLTALGALGVSFAALVHDLGVPIRFVNMLRVAKPTSPMSVGTWFLTAFGLPAGVAAVAEIPEVVPRPLRPLASALGRPAGLAAAGVAPAVATYTAVLLADTAVPTWHEAYPELPFVFAGSAAAAASGVGLLATSVGQASPARRLALLGAAIDLAASQRMESRMGLLAEPLSTGKPGRKLKAARTLTMVGGVAAVALGSRSRTAAMASGAALVAGSVLTRFGFFEAGVASAKDPKYVVQPQRKRLSARDAG